jgi:hypothetical protein
LVFIGIVGAGKTTAICHLFNLVYDAEVVKREGAKERKIIKTQELLSTGAGKTTICEVIIRPASAVSIEIDPYPEKDVQELIEDFCYHIWQKTYPSPTEEGAQPPPAEQIRAIRNITNLNLSTVEKTTVDKATDFARTFRETQFAEFYTAVLNRARLPERVEVRITPPSPGEKSGETGIQAWLQKTFEDINLGKLPNFSIPHKIYVNINSSVLNFEEYPRLGSIVDTRGMDTGQSRKDLASYIRDHDGALCLFTELFPQAPANVADIIGTYLTRESQDISSKFVLLVMPRKGEPEKLVGPNGPVGVREDGMALRKSDIEAAFVSRNIGFVADNILFYDALQYHLSDGRRDPEYTHEDITDERRRILAAIATVISNREESLRHEVSDLGSNFGEIKHGRGMNPQDEQLVKDTKEKIKGFRHLNIPTDVFVPRYIDLWTSRYAMTLRATNARFGTYEPRNIDVYYDAVLVGEPLARAFMQGPKDGILEAIDALENGASHGSDMKPLLKTLKTQINSYHEAAVREVGERTKQLLTTQLLYPPDLTNQFWVEVQNRFGKGPGYKSDVLSMYADQIERANTYLREAAQTLWEEMLLNKVLDFFG